MTEFTPEFVAQVFGRTPHEPEDGEQEPPAPTAPVIPGQGAMPKPVGDSRRLMVNRLFDRIA